MACGLTDPVGCAGQALGGVVDSVASSAWDAICKSFADAASQLLGAFGKAFVAIPPVNLGSAGVRSVYAVSMGIAGVVAALLLLGQVIRTAVTHDGSALAQGLLGVGKAALAFMLTLTIAATALRASDELTDSIVVHTFGSTQALSMKIAKLVAWQPVTSSTLLLVFAVVGILLTVVLWFELLLRNAAVAVLVATSPIGAAGQVSEATKSWWSKAAAATAQLIVLKPVIALVFFLGFSVSGGAKDVETLLVGLLVLLLAVLAWPVVARFFSFAAVQVGGGMGLGAVLGFAAGRGTAGGPTTGVEPDEFSRICEARTIAGGARLASTSAGASTTNAAARSAAGPGGAVLAGLAMAQRAVNSLTGRMEQMAGHAGIPTANPYAQPAGTPQRPVGWPAHPKAAGGEVPDGPSGRPAPAVETRTTTELPVTSIHERQPGADLPVSTSLPEPSTRELPVVEPPAPPHGSAPNETGDDA